MATTEVSSEPAARPTRHWRWWQPVAAFALLIGFGELLHVIPGIRLASGQVLFDLGMLAIPVGLALATHRPLRAAFSLRRSVITPGRTVLWIVLGLLASGFLIGIYVGVFGIHGSTWITREHPHGASATVLALCAVTLVPIAEELFWRGFLHRTLRAYLPMWPAVLLSGTLFGLSHWVGGDALSTAAPRAILGMFLALLLERSGSVYPGMVAHAYLNMGVVFLWAPAIGSVVGPLWFLAALIAIAVSVRDPRRKKYDEQKQARAPVRRPEAHLV